MTLSGSRARPSGSQTGTCNQQKKKREMRTFSARLGSDGCSMKIKPKLDLFKNIHSVEKKTASTTIKELSVPPSPFLQWVVVTWCLCAKLAAVMVVWVCCGPQMRNEDVKRSKINQPQSKELAWMAAL